MKIINRYRLFSSIDEKSLHQICFLYGAGNFQRALCSKQAGGGMLETSCHLLVTIKFIDLLI